MDFHHLNMFLGRTTPRLLSKYGTLVKVVEHVNNVIHDGARYKIYNTCSLVGRDLINPEDYTSKEIASLLWTAKDLKCLMKRRNFKNMDLLDGHNVTILLNNHNMKAEVALPNAVQYLGANVNVIVNCDWEQSSDIIDTGRCLSRITDIILAKSKSHRSMCLLAEGSRVPVVNFSSHMFKPLQGLADLLTLQEYFGYLKNLKLGWVGPPEALFNTYLIMMPKIGINMKFVCTCDHGMPQTPVLLDVALKNCINTHTEITECVTLQEAIYRSDIIATMKHNNPHNIITEEVVSEAAIKWCFLHGLPRFKTEVTDTIFYSPNSLVWESTANMIWVTMAVVLHLLKEYEPSINKPTFEGNVCGV